MKFKIIRFGDSEGNGAIVEKRGWLGTTTWTANNDDKIFEKWVCRETGRYVFKGPYCSIDYFYTAQFNTRPEELNVG